MKKYCVPVIYKGMDNFIVEAGSEEEAKELAYGAFNDGAAPAVCGNEWEKFVDCGKPEEV